MSQKDNSGPAFPVSATNGNLEAIDGFFDGEQIEPGTTVTYRGLSVRDYFAAMVLTVLSSHPMCSATRTNVSRRHCVSM